MSPLSCPIVVRRRSARCVVSRRKARNQNDVPPAVTAERVREMLLELAYLLHATRVVARRDAPVAEASPR
jgi:hypothetical protein